MKTFEKLESRYIFTGAILLTEAMHIGSGEGDERADSLFTCSNGRYYIPGSSLRGALRSTVERIAYSLEKKTCLLFNAGSSSTCVTSNPLLIEVEKQAFERRKEEWNEEEVVRFLQQGGLCDTCKIFGSPYFASKVRITDLFPREILTHPKSAIRYGVGIDRDTETASEGALFEIEAIEKGCKFDFELIAENLYGKEEWGLLCIGLWEMMRRKEEGGTFYIGAKSAEGLGRCQLIIEKLSYFDNNINDSPCDLRKYLDEGPACINNNEVVTFIKEKLDEYLK